MKILIEDTHEDEFSQRVIIETANDNLDIFEMMDKLNDALLALGFHPDTVRNGFCAKADQYEEEADDNDNEQEARVDFSQED